ncbi:MAG: electron transport complex subunit RsxE [Symbiobacteriaceae bacterium]|nr:electron transport complex subunit RsxE [Symbiobacteriaceae bacterium]
MSNEAKPNYMRDFTQGLIVENPLFRLVLGTCPSLATSVAVDNAFWMGLAVIFVLTCSNIIISALRKLIPDKIRIPCFIIVIATFVTIVDMFMNAYMEVMYEKLGIFIPLIVVNCIILARAESKAAKSNIISSALDGLGMGIGYMGAICLMATFREILGVGSFFGVQLFSENVPVIAVMAQPPGAFIALGLLLGLVNLISFKSAKS